MKAKNTAGDARWQGFEDLKTWQLSHQLMLACHRLVTSLPPHERYDLASQLRRSSKSAGANIAEGYGRYHYIDTLRFYYIARGSLVETLNHIIAAHDLAYIGDAEFGEVYELGREAQRALNGYIAHVRKLRTGNQVYGDRYICDSNEIAHRSNDDSSETA